MRVRPVIPCLESVLGSTQRGNQSLKDAPAQQNSQYLLLPQLIKI